MSRYEAYEDDEGPQECPICLDELDLTDRSFKPCKCGYQARFAICCASVVFFLCAFGGFVSSSFATLARLAPVWPSPYSLRHFLPRLALFQEFLALTYSCLDVLVLLEYNQRKSQRKVSGLQAAL